MTSTILNRGASSRALHRGMTRLLCRERRALVSNVYYQVESLNEKFSGTPARLRVDATMVGDSPKAIGISNNATSPQQVSKLNAMISVDFDLDDDDGG